MNARVGGLICAFALVASITQTAKAQHFFPVRPKHVTTSEMSGILTEYGIGNGTGEFSIRNSSGKRIDFFLAYPTYINGRVYACERPPAPNERFDSSQCRAWPKNVVIGSTKVRITYWWMVPPGSSERVRVSDAIRSFNGS